MSKRFTIKGNLSNGYAAMGNAMGRPIYKGIDSGRSVAESIAAERAKAARMARAQGKKK